MFKPLAFILRRIVVRGNLTFITSDGSRHTFGNSEGRPVVAPWASPGRIMGWHSPRF